MSHQHTNQNVAVHL